MSTTTTKIWLDAARPKTLWAAVGPVLMGTAIAIGDERGHLTSALVAMFCAILIQVATNFANDFFDFVKGADTADRKGPRRATQAGLITPEAMRSAFVTVFLLAFLLGLYLVYRGGFPVLVIGLASILFGVLYTGGPYPLGYNGLGDIFVLIFFGPVAVAGTYYVQGLQWSETAIIAGLAPGLISTALLTVNNLRDIDTDKKAGKRTLAVRFGADFARQEYRWCMILAFIIPLILILILRDHYFTTAVFLLLPMWIKAQKTVDAADATATELNGILALTGKFLFQYGILFAIGWLLQIPF